MPEDSSFSLRITAAAAGVGPAEVEQLALQLRDDLLASGVPEVRRVAEGPAPEGTRALELIAAGVSLLATGVSAAASAAQLAEFVQRWIEAHPRRRRIKVEVLAAPAPAPAATVPTGRRVALLVANSRYADPGLSRLRSPVSDIRALADVLGAPGIGAFDVETLVDVDENVLRRRVAAFFADRQPDDVLLLHFSCHGLKDQRGRLYLAAADTEVNSIAATALPASFVSEQMSESASRSVVLILDCCYSGAFARDAAVRADRTVHVAEVFRGGGSGRTVLTASSATEYSFEGGQITSYEAQPSVFTDALVTGLRTGAADLDFDGDISVDELFEYAAQRVREARVDQIPRKWSFDTTGALVVARSVRPAQLPDEVRSDLASHRKVLRLEAVRELALLLSGAREGFRRAAREALVALRDHDDSLEVRAAAAAALGETTPAASADRPPARVPAPVAPPEPVSPPEPVAIPQPVAVAEPVPIAEPVAVAEPVAIPEPEARPQPVATPEPEATPELAPAPAPAPSATRIPPVTAGETPPRSRRRVLALTAVGVALLVAAGTGVPWLISKTGGDSSSSGHGYRLGEAMTTVTLSHDQPIDSAGLSPDGRWAVTYDHKAEEVDADTATVWNAWTGARIGTLQTDGITFSPDGTRIANVYFTGQRSTETVNGQKMGLLSGGDTVVDLLRTEDLSKIATFAGHLGSADVAFSPDSSLVATADTRASEKDFAARIRLWKTDGGSLVSTLTGHANGIQSMEFSHDGRTLVSSAAGGVTKIWDVATGRASATLSNAWFPEWLSPAGEVLVTRTAKGFEVRRLPGGAVVATVTNAGSFVGFSPDGSAYATSSGTTVRLYRTASRQLLQTLEGKVKAPIVASPDGRLIAALADDGTPMLWDPATGKVVASLVGHQQTVTDLVFATDGQVLMTVGVDKTVRRWYANSSLLPAPSGSASAAPTGSAG